MRKPDKSWSFMLLGGVENRSNNNKNICSFVGSFYKAGFLCSPDCPRIPRDSAASALGIMGLKVCVTMLGSESIKYDCYTKLRYL